LNNNFSHLFDASAAILVATSIKLKSPLPEGSDSEGPHQHESQASEYDNDAVHFKQVQSVESVISGGLSSSRSVSHARNIYGAVGGSTVANIRVQETVFIQTFVLMYHMMLFGLVLFGIYLLDKYPLNGGHHSSSQNTVAVLSDPFQFNADQFLSWMALIVVYSCYASWKRNDGKPHETETTLQSKVIESTNNQEGDTDIQSTKQTDSSLRQTQLINLNSGLRRDEAPSTISRGSSHSGFNQRLEDILLEDVLGHDDHDTIDDAFENARLHDKGCLERSLSIMGLHRFHTGREGVIRELHNVDDVLNPLQALEWKGLLSVAFLVYQYCSGGRGGTYMAQVDPDDEQNNILGFASPVWSNLELVGVSSFLFLTGYNHTSYYYYHPDNLKSTSQDSPQCYGLSRVLGIIFRWNWTAAFLSLALGNNIFQHYVVCPIHSYFFLMIWLMLRVCHSTNYTKYKFRLKMFAFAVSPMFTILPLSKYPLLTVVFCWQCLIVTSDIIFSRFLKHDLATKSVFWEWRYLCHLHHLAPYAGALFAINKPTASLQIRKLESYSFVISTMAKGSVCLALTTAVIAWAVGPLQRYTYDKIHSVFGVVPLLAFVYWRNLSYGFRSNHNHFFSWVGQYSLEIVLLSKHTMYHDSFAVILPGYPHLNFLLLCIGVIVVARLLNNLTSILRQLLVPENDEQSSFMQATTFTAGISVLYLFSKLLCWADLITVGSIATIVIILGVLLYQVIMDMSWSEYQSLSTGRQSSADTAESNVTKISVPLSGIMSIFVVAASWYGWTTYIGATTALDATCINDVNNGFWLPINACNVRSELNDGVNYFGYAECDNFMIGKEWTWPKEYSHCGFRFRSGNDIRSSLLHKRVTFIGDSSVRNLFYSLCRSMGDNDAGGYEGVASHADIRRLFPSANLEYKWAPLSVDIVSKLKSLRSTDFSSGKPKPDLLVLGGGTWDKLHMAATDEDQQSHREVVARLAVELNKLRELEISVVWMVPPVVNSIALNSDEKRVQMGEQSLEDTR
jgi:hypothetical protein